MDKKAARIIKVGGKIVALINAYDGIYCYTPDNTYKMRTPEEIDLGDINPDTPFEKSIYRKVGTRNWITARVIVQNRRMFDTINGFFDEKAIFHQLMECETNLLSCNKISKVFCEHIKKTSGRQVVIKNGVINKLPSIDELDIRVYHFLVGAKQVLQCVCNIYNVFWGTKLNGPHITYLLDSMKKRMDHDNQILKALLECETALFQIVEMRNAQEHADNRKYLKMYNYCYDPSSGKIKFPYLAFYKDGFQYGFDIAEWCKSIVSNLVVLIEYIMIDGISGCVKKLPDGFGVTFKRIPDNKIDTECPVRMAMELVILNQETVINSGKQIT